MSVSLEKIDMLMERANISYKEAKEALEAHNGDMVEALISLEASNKTASSKTGPRLNRPHAHHQGHSRPRPQNDFFDDLKKFFDKMHKTSFVIGNTTKRLIDIPLTIAALLILFTMPVSLFILILPYVFGYKISILDNDGKNIDIEKVFESPKKKDDEDRME